MNDKSDTWWVKLREFIKPSYRDIEPAEPIGDARDMLKEISFVGFDNVEEIDFRFEHGVYRIDTSGEKPEFVEKEEREGE